MAKKTEPALKPGCRTSHKVRGSKEIEENIVDREVCHDMEHAYIDYAMSVITDRAIPDVRDGLKPVQRRILYGMDTLGVTPDKPHKKSARIVGEVMGKYHPHGDCLKGDTGVFCRDGKVRTIKELYDSGCESMEIFATDKDMNVVPATAHYFRIGQYTNAEFIVSFSDGSKVVCTDNHPFRLVTGDYCKANDLKPGMAVAFSDVGDVETLYKLYQKDHIEQMDGLKMHTPDHQYPGVYAINKTCQGCVNASCVVESVRVKAVKHEPMYDFTVDGYENMFVVGKEEGLRYRLINVHNSSIYEAMVRMAQDFSMRYPLVDGHGNFGSIDGDGAAASRYTEARMSPFSTEMVRDIEKDTVDMVPNYDGEEKEPSVLPSRIPNLLANGANGIAVGMATNIPPHNLGNAIDAAVELIDHPDADVNSLMSVIKGPDFPTGGKILGKDGIRSMYETGQGKIKMRAVCRIEPLKRGKSQIVVTEIPYGINKARLIEKIAEKVKDRTITGISEIRDESSREGLRIVIEVRKGTDPEITLNKLYKHTDLQANFSAQVLALENGTPKLLTLKEILKDYIDFQEDVVRRRTKYDLKKDKEKDHILEGLLVAIDNIDEVIRIIRSSYKDAKKKLRDTFDLDSAQAQAILDMRLARLQGLEQDKLKKEHVHLQKEIERFEKILADETKLLHVVRKELIEVKEKWGDKRRTKIVRDDGNLDTDDLVQEKDVTIAITDDNMLRCCCRDKFKAGENDRFTIDATTKDTLLLFSSKGRLFSIPVYQIPDTGKSQKGTPLDSVAELYAKEDVLFAACISDYTESRTFLVCLSNGKLKKLNLSACEAKKSPIVYAKLSDEESIISVFEDSGNDILMLTEKGKAIRFYSKEVSEMGRNAAGVQGIKLSDGDALIDAADFEKGDQITLHGFVFTDSWRRQKRGGKGRAAVKGESA